jgi:hypothetical protein
MSPTVLHVIPSGVFANTYQGSYKDTISRVHYLQGIGKEYRQVQLDDDTPEIVLAALPAHDNVRVLVEYTQFPRVVRALKRRSKNIFVAVRAHNIEPLQHLDNHGWWPRRGPVWLLYAIWRLFAADLATKRHADVVYSISDWENRVYWNRLPGRGQIEWLPYYCPEHLAPGGEPPVARRRVFACLPTSQKNRKSWDLVTRFIAFSESARPLTDSSDEFLITGAVADWELPAAPSVKYAGMVGDLRTLLRTVKAVAMLSPLGHGFKTTIADAIASGCYVLAHPTLAKSCPELLRSAIIPVDITRPNSIRRALEQVEKPLPMVKLNDRLREINHSILARDFPANDGLENEMTSCPAGAGEALGEGSPIGSRK